MKLLKPLFLTASSLLFAGCCTCFPQQQYDKNIVFVQGKPYLVPYGTKFSNVPVSSDITVKDYRLAGTECRKGYITWTSPEVDKELKEVYRNNGADAFSYAYQMAIRDHRMGCSRPLSDSEYRYYKTQYGL